MKKYEIVANDISVRIKNGEFKETKKLPTEDQLMKEYKVSRNTIRTAIKTLINMGLIFPIQGSGLYVKESRKKDTIFINGTQGITADHSNRNIISKCLKIEIIEADDILSQMMMCKKGDELYYLERLRILDGIPYCIEYTYYKKDIVPYLNKDIAESSIFSYIKNDLKLQFGYADKYISCRKMTQNEAELLQLKEGDPTILIEDNIYLASGELFNSSVIVYNYKLANFFLTTT